MPKLKDTKPVPESVLIEVPIAEVLPATWGLHALAQAAEGRE